MDFTWNRAQIRFRIVVTAVATLSVYLTAAASAQWTQYGGPGQDFHADSTGLAKEWPSAGPPLLWRRPLGEGYSAILADGGRLYTMYRAGASEIVVCLDAETGRTVWEFAYDSAPPQGHIADYGNGPNSTPLLSEGRLYTIGVAGVMHCLDAATGRMFWKHDLLVEFDGTILGYGYSSCPVAYKDTIITLVGGAGHGLVAFSKKDGAVAWKGLDFVNSYSTPKVLRIGGADHLVAFMATEIIGADPAAGALKWQYPIRNVFGQNISMPIFGPDDILFFSALDGGAHGMKLTRDGADVGFEKLWTTHKINFFYQTAVQIGDHIYGSTGRPGSTFIAAVNMRTGKITWRKRGFTRANVLAADGYLIILDDSGVLALTTASPDEFTVHSKIQLLEAPAWTVPTLAGGILYLRDRKCIAALDLKCQ